MASVNPRSKKIEGIYSPYLKYFVYISLPYCWNWLSILLIAIYIPEYNKLWITKNCLINFLLLFWMMDCDFVHVRHQTWGAIRAFRYVRVFSNCLQKFWGDGCSEQSIFFNRPNDNFRMNESVPAMHPSLKLRIKISQIIIRVQV